jgi:predicted ATPase
MKLRHVMIRNFKGIAGPLEMEFAAVRPTDMRQLTCLIGDNGSGKTTVLQAIALLLSMATRRTRFSNDFNWHGYEPERISSQGPTRIELRVSQDTDEIELTQRLFREYLVGMWGYHTSPHRVPERDYIASLEAQFAELFPGTKFRGLELRENVETTNPHDFFFLLERQGRIYDLAEMSSGEQAVFPLVYEFIRLSIAKSIVLIDELELHLHPPEQQALLASLSRIGPDCQYFITTHSKYLTGIIPQEHLFRMQGGRRCL